MAGHFIVCGMGQVGYRIVQLLQRLGERVTVISLASRDDWLRDAEASGARVMTGDARDERLLLESGLLEARALIAATDRDLANVEIMMDARRVRPDLPIVVRLFDQHLAHQLETTFDIRRALAMSALAAPSFAAAALGEQVVASFALDTQLFVVGRLPLESAPQLAGLSLCEIRERHGLAALACESPEAACAVAPPPDTRPRADERLTLIGSRAAWDAVTARPGAPGLAAQRRRRWEKIHHSLQLSSWTDFARQMWHNTPLPLRTVFLVLNLLILMSVFVFHFAMNLSLVDAFYFVVETVTTVGYGDVLLPKNPAVALKLYVCLVMLLGSVTLAVLYSIITDFVVTARFQQLLGRQRIPQADHVVVVGLGNVGYRTAMELHRGGAHVVAIERNAEGQFVEAVRACAPVILGDARVRDPLAKAGVAHARALIAATSDDVVNLGVALAAKQLNPGIRTVARLLDAEFARKAQATLNIDAAMSPPLAAAPTFVAAALYPGVQGAFVISDILFAILWRMVDGCWSGRTPAELRSREEMQVLLRQSPAGGGYRTAGDAPLQEGETVLAVVWRGMVD
jgi:Trk K+ transport system NAD-binding subunit